MLTSKQAVRLQISKPEAGGGCEVGQNSAASQGGKKFRGREKGFKEKSESQREKGSQTVPFLASQAYLAVVMQLLGRA